MKILYTPGLTLQHIDDSDVARIREAGGGAQFVVRTEDATDIIGDIDVVLGKMPKRLFGQAKKLRWVQSISSGVDDYMYEEFVKSDVLLTSEKGLVGEHLADHAFGLLLMLTRQLAAADRLRADAWNHRWELRANEIELHGKSMGIIGFGGTGRAVARRAVAFGMSVCAIDRDPVAPTEEVPEVWPTTRFDSLLGDSDVVAVCCPLTAETRGLLDKRAFSQMRDTAFLVNVTRGEIMIEEDLIDAVKDGQIRGAALDVAPREPLPATSELWTLPQVVMSPHTAGASQYRARRNLERFIRNLRRFRNNEPLEGLIDKSLGY